MENLVANNLRVPLSPKEDLKNSSSSPNILSSQNNINYNIPKKILNKNLHTNYSSKNNNNLNEITREKTPLKNVETQHVENKNINGGIHKNEKGNFGFHRQSIGRPKSSCKSVAVNDQKTRINQKRSASPNI